MNTYLIHGRTVSADDADFAERLATAHAEQHRPLCLCVDAGLEMYVARLGETFILKRMPYTGSLHSPGCPSYEPPPDVSGLGEVLGSAIREDPTSGTTLLRLGFAISKAGTRAVDGAAASDHDSVASDGTRLTLRGLLHYLWDQGGLTRWQPAFAGRRSWATVRKLLLQAAANKIVRDRLLAERLYIPEAFCVEQRDAINARRLCRWSHATTPATRRRDLMLLIGEAKEFAPARFGFRAIVKHVPDQAFALDEQLYRRMERRFAAELSLWSSSSGLHMVLIATFGVNDVGVPVCEELSLMPTTPQWLPIEDSFEVQLLERLIADGRHFAKSLRYDLDARRPLATAMLLDTTAPYAMHVVRPDSLEANPQEDELESAAGELSTWRWRVDEPIPPLPPSRMKTHGSEKSSSASKPFSTSLTG